MVSYFSGLPKARAEGLVVQKSNKELLVYDLRENRAMSLNETSALVWLNCDGEKTVDKIAIDLGHHLGVTTSRDLIYLALRQLQKEQLLDETLDFSQETTFRSRREMIKRVGFSGAIALPIISSVVAPPAVRAQSCVPGGSLPTGTMLTSGSTTTCPNPFCDTLPAASTCCSGTATMNCTGPPAGGNTPFDCVCT